jgi:hypothetical protein
MDMFYFWKEFLGMVISFPHCSVTLYFKSVLPDLQFYIADVILEKLFTSNMGYWIHLWGELFNLNSHKERVVWFVEFFFGGVLSNYFSILYLLGKIGGHT